MRWMDETAVDVVADARPHLWAVAVLFFGVGDLVTTTVGLESRYVAEVGPVVAPIIAEHGYLAMLLLKLLAFGVCYLMYRLVPSPHRVGVPLGLATLGVLVSGWNVVVLYAAP